MTPYEMLVAAALALGLWLFAAWQRRTSRARSRLAELGPRAGDSAAPATRSRRAEDGAFDRFRAWLSTAGLRDPRAPWIVIGALGIAILLGTLLALWLSSLPVLRQVVEDVRSLPGGTGEVFAVLVSGLPLLAGGLIALAPLGYVSGKRSRRLEAVERELPMVLELFATLAEAGQGIDAAMQRVISAHGGGSVLVEELALFQREVLAGLPRRVCYRRLAARVDVPNLNSFVSAMIRSEQVGSGLARTVRQQADDVWNRRREFALLRSQVLPVKMAFPLVICFLPGIFVYTLGPAFKQFLEMADSLTR